MNDRRQELPYHEDFIRPLTNRSIPFQISPDRQRRGVEYIPAPRERRVPDTWYESSIFEHQVHIGQTFLRADKAPILWMTFTHDLEKRPRLSPTRRHEQKIVRVPQQRASRFMYESEFLPFQIGVEEAAQKRRERGALRDAYSLSEEFAAYLDEVASDVLFEQAEHSLSIFVRVDDRVDEDDVAQGSG